MGSNWNQLGIKLEWNEHGHDVRNRDQTVTNGERVRYVWLMGSWRGTHGEATGRFDGTNRCSTVISRERSTCHMFSPKISFNSGTKMHGACIGKQHPKFALHPSGKQWKVLYCSEIFFHTSPVTTGSFQNHASARDRHKGFLWIVWLK